MTAQIFPSPHLQPDNIPIISVATASIAPRYRLWVYVYFQLLNAVRPKETAMTRKSFYGQTVAPDCKQRNAFTVYI